MDETQSRAAARIRSQVGLYREVPVERYQLLRRLVHRWPDGSQHVTDRGEGEPARLRIERLLRQLAMSSAPRARLAAQALYAGWEDRR